MPKAEEVFPLGIAPLMLDRVSASGAPFEEVEAATLPGEEELVLVNCRGGIAVEGEELHEEN